MASTPVAAGCWYLGPVLTLVPVCCAADGCRDDHRASVCRSVRLLLRESAVSLRFPLRRPPSRLCTFAGHMLEHSEDDTKSLFVVIKVCIASCRRLGAELV